MRFLSWECWDFLRRHNHFRRFPKKAEVFRRSPRSSEDVQSLPKTSEGEVIEKTLIHKIRDDKVLSFILHMVFVPYMGLSNIFLEILSSKTAATHIFQSGVRNWPASVSWREIEVFKTHA